MQGRNVSFRCRSVSSIAARFALVIGLLFGFDEQTRLRLTLVPGPR